MSSDSVKSSQIASKLNLKAHPEGGFFSETFRDTSIILSKSQLPLQCVISIILSIWYHVRLEVTRDNGKLIRVTGDNGKLIRLEVTRDNGKLIRVTGDNGKLIRFILHHKVDRPISTCIYFLLPSGSVSHLHRIPCAETWHFYMGEPLTVMELNDEDGTVKLTCIGSNPLKENQHVQHTVPPNVWFGAFPTRDIEISTEKRAFKTAPRDAEAHFSLVGCTCAPAFQFDDFELAKRSELVSKYPKYEALINMLTFEE